MTLGEQQRRFLPLVARLIDWAYAHGYELTAGELYRTPEQAALNAQSGAGIAHSLHTQRLAVDLQLFVNGVYQTDTPSYKPLGDFWVSLDPDCCWGGSFVSRPDGNHFSLQWGGVK